LGCTVSESALAVVIDSNIKDVSAAVATHRRRVRVIHFSPWAERLENVDTFLLGLPALDLSKRVTSPDLVPMARLDADWHGENSRAFASMTHPDLEFLPARVTGPTGLLDLAASRPAENEELWLIFEGQTPQKLAGVLKKLLPILSYVGVRFFWYAFDEVSRTTTAFQEFAPFLHVLIHDENPLDSSAKTLLRATCHTLHRSWVANVVPFAAPFNEQPEQKIVFLGSKLGLTENRKRQIEFLKRTYGDRFVAIFDHSVPVAERNNLNRFKVSLCPEGRKFGTPAMSATHTDRPFWSGCLGMIPVSENSRAGDRLSELTDTGLLQRYEYGDLDSLKACCDRALTAATEDRRRIYDHYNRRETVGSIVAEALHQYGFGLTGAMSHSASASPAFRSA
jgi:hypothetical protein